MSFDPQQLDLVLSKGDKFINDEGESLTIFRLLSGASDQGGGYKTKKGVMTKRRIFCWLAGNKYTQACSALLTQSRQCFVKKCIPFEVVFKHFGQQGFAEKTIFVTIHLLIDHVVILENKGKYKFLGIRKWPQFKIEIKT